jgi:hypothetical protein
VDDAEVEPWYAVRCVFAFGDDAITRYEERVTLWHADSFHAAVEMAEHDATEYAEVLDAEYVGLAQVYHLAIPDRPPESGDEVFSLIRRSTLGVDDYVRQFFATGEEHEGTFT